MITSKVDDLSNSRNGREIIESLAKCYLASGDLKEEDLKSGDTLYLKMRECLKKNGEPNFVIDHRDSLLVQAAKFFKSGDTNLSIMLYATYFEHELNKIINHALFKKNVSIKAKNELIRSVNIAGKCGWLLEVLGLPRFNEKHGKIIIDLSSERNAFVHYKWNLERFDDVSENKIELIGKVRKTASYMKRYSSIIQYNGQEGNLKKALTKSST